MHATALAHSCFVHVQIQPHTSVICMSSKLYANDIDILSFSVILPKGHVAACYEQTRGSSLLS